MKKKMIDFLKRFVFSYLLIKVSFGAIVWFYLRIIHRKQIRIIGQENIPRKNRILFYANHPTMMDPILLLTLGFFPQVIFKPGCFPWSLAAEENFLTPDCKKVPILKNIPLIRNLPLAKWALENICIPVKPDRKDPQALKRAVEKLKQGKSILIFPEGHRTKGSQGLDTFQKGAGLLVYQVQPEIIPIKIIGAEKILPRGKEWPDWSKGKITIIFGQSIANRLNRYRKGLYKHLPKKFIYSRIVKIMREELKKLPPSGES
jgi:1-acyl-sn-glycerol-3-phosphate acyltransferase